MATPRSIFVNIVVDDLPTTRAYFSALGFSFNEQFSNHEAACMVVSELAYYMLHTPPSMARFTELPAANPHTHTSAIHAFSVSSRDEVDRLANAALAEGGTAFNPDTDHGFMYLRSFRDPSGHPWEVFWMNPAHVEA